MLPVRPVRGCRKWQAEALTQLSVVRSATKGWRQEMDALKRFVTEQLVIAPGLKILSSQLFDRYKKWCVHHGEEALTVYAEGKDSIAVAVVDVRMPRLDGPQTVAALKALNPNLPCCYMTGHGGQYTNEDLLTRGGLHVFDKPFQFEVMRQALDGLLAPPMRRSA